METTAGHGGSWMSTLSGVVNIYDDIDSGEAERIAQHGAVTQIQFARKFDVSVATLQALNELVLTRHPKAWFRETFNGCGAFNDLGFLDRLSNLRSLTFSGNSAVDLGPIVEHGAIENLKVGGRGTSLRPLKDIRQLKFLGLHDNIRHPEVIGTFGNLMKLSFTSQRLKGVGFLSQLENLRVLSFFLGGTRNFEDLSGLPGLEEFSIRRTRELEVEHLVPLNRVGTLRRLAILEQPRITSFGWLTNPGVTDLVLENWRTPLCYTTLAGLPNLSTLVLRNEVTPSQLEKLAALPSLNALYVYEDVMKELDTHLMPFDVRPIAFSEDDGPP